MAAQDSRLQRELRQTKPFASASQEAILGLLRTADVLRVRVTVLLEPHDITPQQYNVLRILRGAEPAGLPTLDVAERMIERTPGITRLLDRLEHKQLALRTRCRIDRRRIFCRITCHGLELLATLDPQITELHKVSTASLSLADHRRLIQILDTLRETVPADPNVGPHRANYQHQKEKSS